MKKNKILSSVLAVVILIAFIVCAKIEADTQIISDTLYTFVAEFPATIIKHTPITNVSANTRVLNAKINVDFGCYTSANAKILYYLNGDSSNVREESENNIPNKQDFFIALPQFSETDNKVDYQVEVTLKANGEETKMYYPVNAEEKPYYLTATIQSSSSSVINGNQGGTVSYDTGDQNTGGVSVEVPAGSYEGDDVVTIEEIDPNLLGAPAYMAPSRASAGSSKALMAYKIAKGGNLDVVSEPPLKVTFKYPNMKKGDKFVIKRGASASEVNEALKTTVNYDTKEVIAMSPKYGFFGLYFAASSDNDYKPARRVIVKARAESRGDVFQFNCLKEGDSVKIYNVNGKKVRELKGNSFAWDGKNDDGQYVESGTYIYQIKADGKIINGTIAFVK